MNKNKLPVLLLIEDEACFVQDIAKQLRDILGGFIEIISASNEKEALSLFSARAKEIDMVAIDHYLAPDSKKTRKRQLDEGNKERINTVQIPLAFRKTGFMGPIISLSEAGCICQHMIVHAGCNDYAMKDKASAYIAGYLYRMMELPVYNPPLAKKRKKT